MSSSAPTASWNGQGGQHRCGRPPRALEIVGVVFAFIYFWPLAVAYLIWKFMGYPVPNEARTWIERTIRRPFRSPFSAATGFRGTGNSAFADYRQRELERLDQERRRLDEEAQAFATFVEDLKRAKDREEFDAFMAKRRAADNGSTAAV